MPPVINNENKMVRFNLYKDLYNEAELSCRILGANALEYVSLSWLPENDRDPLGYAKRTDNYLGSQ